MISEHLINTAAAPGHSIIVKLASKVPTPITKSDNKFLQAIKPSTLNIDYWGHLGLEDHTWIGECYSNCGNYRIGTFGIEGMNSQIHCNRSRVLTISTASLEITCSHKKAHNIACRTFPAKHPDQTNCRRDPRHRLRGLASIMEVL